MISFKKVIALLPDRFQYELKRIYYSRQIKKDLFITDEPEFKILSQFVKPGDWVIDIGANVGHYTKKFSNLVGPYGRVIAIEPVPITFSLLSANANLFFHSNVSLLNLAVSDRFEEVGMFIPKLPNGLNNYYEARISNEQSVSKILTLPLDSLSIEHPIALVKVDTEGHEESVLAGMKNLLRKFHPVLIIESNTNKIITFLEEYSYVPIKVRNSPNLLFK